jgi:hypothetical protein
MITRWMSLALGILLLTVTPERVSAQDLSIGGRLGLVGGEVYFEDKEADDLSSPMPGLQMGGVAAYRLGSVISLQAELWYVQKGWNETLYGGGRRLSYLEMPLLVIVTAPWKTAPQLIAGASVGVELDWHYGLAIGHSSLIVRAPEQGLDFVIVANTSRLTGAYDIGQWDVRECYPARLFVEKFVLGSEPLPVGRGVWNP